MKDWRGAEVGVGDPVIYASRSGSTLNIIQGVVREVVGDVAVVEFVRDRYSRHGWTRKQKTFRVSGKYLTVVYELPRTDDAS